MNEEVTEKMQQQIVVDDGTEEIEVLNKKGATLGKFVFRPADLGIVDRWNTMADTFDTVVAPLEKLGDNATPDEGLAALAEAKKLLCDALDKVFDGNVSEAFFGSVDPFALVSGKFYCENVMDAVASYMSARFSEEFKHVNARQNKKVVQYASNVRRNR